MEEVTLLALFTIAKNNSIPYNEIQLISKMKHTADTLKDIDES